MTSPTLLSLADRVESERPSQELNADIWLATRVGFSERSFNHWCGMQPKGSNPTKLEYARDRAPNFSGSLDAAMTLLPPTHRWLMNGPDVDGAGDDIKPCASVMPYGEHLTHPQDSHEAATPVLAFLSAVLRARSALESSHD